jgi:hypothetical protein
MRAAAPDGATDGKMEAAIQAAGGTNQNSIARVSMTGTIARLKGSSGNERRPPR